MHRFRAGVCQCDLERRAAGSASSSEDGRGNAAGAESRQCRTLATQFGATGGQQQYESCYSSHKSFTHLRARVYLDCTGQM